MFVGPINTQSKATGPVDDLTAKESRDGAMIEGQHVTLVAAGRARLEKIIEPIDVCAATNWMPNDKPMISDSVVECGKGETTSPACRPRLTTNNTNAAKRTNAFLIACITADV